MSCSEGLPACFWQTLIFRGGGRFFDLDVTNIDDVGQLANVLFTTFRAGLLRER